ncbi:trace amine-associated receptor 13c-like [Erpetoichthys calabaricus]|uniref:trace amine-associated receptor 13c-like n=1 Tax=Erpetoichthys calabaricus TaxID=27687 RepID=UPI002233F3A3|nr:trace amine-associated receptor 13c-like [Erpetoichthys calabaricus]
MDNTNLNSQQLVKHCFPLDNASCLRETRSPEVYVMLYIFSTVSVMLAIFGNLLVVISVSHFKQLHTPSNLLVLSLAVADFLVGISLMPFRIIKIIDNCWYFGDKFCYLNFVIDCMLTSVSMSNLVFIAIDRYIAVCDPLLYSAKVTVPVTQLSITTSWFSSIFYTWVIMFFKGFYVTSGNASICVGECEGFYAESWGLVDFIITFLIPCSIIVHLYSKIFIVAKRHLKIISFANQQKNTQFVQQKMTPKKSERKAAKTLGIAISVFLFCWIPYYICSIVDTYTNVAIPNILFSILTWLVYLNSGMNPIIYALFYPWFQKSVKLIVTLKIFNPESSLISLFAVNS